MTEDASQPEDTQEAERDGESSENVATVADSQEPVTVAPDGEEAGDEADGDSAAEDADGEDVEGEDVLATDDSDRDAPTEESAAGPSGASTGVTVEPAGEPEAASPGADDERATVESEAPEESVGDADASEASDAETADGTVQDEAVTDAESGEDGDADAADADTPENAEASVPTEDAEVSDAPETASEQEQGPTLPDDVRKYDRFQKMDGAQYDRVNEFLRDRTYITAREWAIARLCADFRTETGVEMTKIGENLPHLVPFMTDTYTPQAVNQARSAFEQKVRQAGATFLYGAMCDFFTADELDDLMYEVTEVAKFLLEVEGVDLTVEEELEAEERISSVMREVRQSSDELRHEGVCCPECGHEFEAHEADDSE